MKHVPIKLFGKEMHCQTGYRILPRMHHYSGAQTAASMGKHTEHGAVNPKYEGSLSALISVCDAKSCCRE